MRSTGYLNNARRIYCKNTHKSIFTSMLQHLCSKKSYEQTAAQSQKLWPPQPALALTAVLTAVQPRRRWFMVSTTQRERSSRCGVSVHPHTAESVSKRFFKRITSATAICDRGDSFNSGIMTHLLIITRLTAARPERSNARAKRVALSRGWSEAKPSVSCHPT